MKSSKLCLDFSDNPKVVQHLRVLSARRRITQKAIVEEALSQYFARDQENDFIRDYGFPEYAKWHLAVDERHSPNSKARYRFPFGDFQNVHRCGLLAVKSRAREFGYHEIEAAAAKLLAMIDQSTHALKNASINSGRSSL